VKLLLTKSQILETLGDVEASTEALYVALPLIDERNDPRTALGVQFQFLVNLCLQGRSGEAKPHLPSVQMLAERLGMEVDLQRLSWLKGKVLAGIGQFDDAEEEFERVRRYFASQQLGLECALVSLDLALLLLAQGRTDEVRTLTAQMAWIFKSQGIHREALSALKVFCDAAENDAATAELTNQIVRFLHRSRRDPELTFGASEEDEAWQ
jgi:tetratricopeptide (TPR) repeat protein